MQLMKVASFVIDRTDLYEWFPKCNMLIYFFSVIGDVKTEKPVNQ